MVTDMGVGPHTEQSTTNRHPRTAATFEYHCRSRLRFPQVRRRQARDSSVAIRSGLVDIMYLIGTILTQPARTVQEPV